MFTHAVYSPCLSSTSHLSSHGFTSPSHLSSHSFASPFSLSSSSSVCMLQVFFHNSTLPLFHSVAALSPVTSAHRSHALRSRTINLATKSGRLQSLAHRGALALRIGWCHALSLGEVQADLGQQYQNCDVLFSDIHLRIKL